MGSSDGGCNELGTQKKMKPYLTLILLSSLSVSIVGIFVLGWWIYKYHPANRELWMVPFGLILFITPVIVGFSLIVSGPSVSKKEDGDGEQEVVSDIKK